MTTVVLNGVSFTEEEMADRGHLARKIVNGTSYPNWQAMHVAALTDSSKHLVTTSSTSLTVGTGTQTFTLALAVPVYPGMDFKLARQAAPSTVYMVGVVTAYDGLTGEVTATITRAVGSGTFTDWNFGPTGERGEPGAPGDMDIVSLTEDTGGFLANDMFPKYSAASAANRKVSAATLRGQMWLLNQVFSW